MNTWLTRARRRLSFANVTSAIALFVALGGTSYAAITLPNGVDRSEIRRDAVGGSEIRGNAVSSDEVKDGTLQADDLSTAGKTALAALNGVTFRVASTGGGGAAGGNAKAIAHTPNTGVYTVDLGQDVSACEYAATLGGVKSGATIEPPAADAGRVTASPSTDATKVVVSTAQSDGTPVDSAFHLLVAC